jgi:hypothetical protein
MSTKEIMPLWFQTVLSALLFAATTYYLIRSWRRRSVIVGLTISSARRGFNGDASRDSEPALYWWGMFCVFAIDVIFFVIMVMRVYAVLGK